MTLIAVVKNDVSLLVALDCHLSKCILQDSKFMSLGFVITLIVLALRPNGGKTAAEEGLKDRNL